MPPKKTVLTGLLLAQKGDVKEVKLPLDAEGQFTEAGIQKLLKQKTEPELLGAYPFNSGEAELLLFGYTTGKAGGENNHELPPPNDGITVFGDILVIQAADADSWTAPLPLKVADYEAFYAKAFGGGDSEEESEAEVEQAEEEAAAGGESDAESEGADAESEAGESESGESDAGDEEGDSDAGEDVAEVIDGDDEEAAVRPVLKAPRAKAKAAKKGAVATAAAAKRSARKSAAAATALAAAAVASYANYFHVDSATQLRPEGDADGPPGATALPAARAKVLKTLSILFTEHLEEADVAALERAVYNGALEAAGHRHIGKSWDHAPFVELYRMHAKHLAANFHPGSYVGNGELFQKFKDGHISIAELAWMDPYQLFEARWRDSFVQQQGREKRQLEGNKAMATDRFLCTRCWKRECTYYEMQTRSADEPMTIFITCLNCGKHWRQ